MSDRSVDPVTGAASPAGDAWILPAEPICGTTTTTATGHRATLTHCRCGLPAGGEGYDVAVDPEPGGVSSVTVLGQVPGVARWDRGADGLWHPVRTRYQAAGPPLPWRALGVCAARRRHRLVPVAPR
ncbi:hypothetical protein [Actinomycetospora cinnamomea]|uniref:Uncharacterized protein n=1 Tax=Actinomycetospora cinnamomea TaxID=663609 RepID=A0A2U1FF69_9PSEU|nr:hypothetical protein [Actinomycetospora cinnamomea]PVZ10797.1 hypothetical protein C8D89_1047 [Actinomycetospora cinnamomea]